MAHICMDAFDTSVQQACLYGRFIDDCICILPVTRVSEFMNQANAWHPSITVEQAAIGRSAVPYLDITITLDSVNSCTFELYRKPLNLYQYLPRASCHRSSIFASLVKGEALRILRRCTSPLKARVHLCIFKSHLIRRGYSAAEVNKAFARAHHSQSGLNRQTQVSVRKVFLKVQHSSTVNYGAISSALSKHSHMLKGSCKIVCATTVQRNIFRLLCSSTWRPNKLAVGG